MVDTISRSPFLPASVESQLHVIRGPGPASDGPAWDGPAEASDPDWETLESRSLALNAEETAAGVIAVTVVGYKRGVAAFLETADGMMVGATCCCHARAARFSRRLGVARARERALIQIGKLRARNAEQPVRAGHWGGNGA